MSSVCRECWCLGWHCQVTLKETSWCPSPSEASCMQKRLGKCSCKTVSGILCGTQLKMASEQSLMLMELLVLMEEQRKPKVFPLRMSLHSVIPHEWSPSLFPWSQKIKSLLGQWQLSDSISICPRITAVAVRSSIFWDAMLWKHQLSWIKIPEYIDPDLRTTCCRFSD